jgi:hypothetical protein
MSRSPQPIPVARPTYAPASFGPGGAPPVPLEELVVDAAEELVAAPPVPPEDVLVDDDDAELLLVLPVDELAPPLPAVELPPPQPCTRSSTPLDVTKKCQDFIALLILVQR